MKSRHGPRRVADMVPSAGEKLYRRRVPFQKQRPVELQGGIRHRSVKVVRMFNWLQENGWTFRFSLEAMSPRGWPYRGEGATAEEAFLRAFRAWEKERKVRLPEKAPAPVIRPTPEPVRIPIRRHRLKTLAMAEPGPDGVIRASWERPASVR